MITALSTRVPEKLVRSLENPVYLGDWCLDDLRRPNLNSEEYRRAVPVLMHPWRNGQDRAMAIKDFNKYFNEVMPRVASQLNETHGVKFSNRYWEILVGPWLRTFGFVAYEKFALLNDLVITHEDEVQLVVQSSSLPPVQDTYEFKDVYTTDEHMSFVTSEVAKMMDLRLLQIDYLDYQRTRASEPSASNKQVFRDSSMDFLSRFSRRLGRQTEAVFFQTFQGPWRDFLWSVSLGQLPLPRSFPRTPAYVGKLDLGFRDVSVETENPSFQQILFALAKRNLPICFLENYQTVCRFVDDLDLPKRPRWIFTSNAYFKFESFKIYAARQADMGTPFLIGQHGGGFGTAEENSHERHIQRVADAFFTWGWHDGAKEVPTSVIKPWSQLRPNPKGYLLLVQFVAPKFVHEPSTMPLGRSSWIEYWEDQLLFYQSLPQEVRSRVKVRLYPGDVQGLQRRLWKEAFPDVQFDDPRISFKKSLSRAALAIVTYESTTYLECLRASFPMICFWREDHWLMRANARDALTELKGLGVFFESPLSAALAVSEFNCNPEALNKTFGRASASNFSNSYARKSPSLAATVQAWTRRNSQAQMSQI